MDWFLFIMIHHNDKSNSRYTTCKTRKTQRAVSKSGGCFRAWALTHAERQTSRRCIKLLAKPSLALVDHASVTFKRHLNLDCQLESGALRYLTKTIVVLLVSRRWQAWFYGAGVYWFERFRVWRCMNSNLVPCDIFLSSLGRRPMYSGTCVKYSVGSLPIAVASLYLTAAQSTPTHRSKCISILPWLNPSVVIDIALSVYLQAFGRYETLHIIKAPLSWHPKHHSSYSYRFYHRCTSDCGYESTYE